MPEHHAVALRNRYVCAVCGVIWPCLEAQLHVARVTQAQSEPAYRIGDKVVLRARGGGARQNDYEVIDLESTRSGWLYTIVGPHRTRTAFEPDLQRA